MKLLVTRPALDAGPLSDLLTAAGHTILLDPLLSIRFRDRTALDLDGITGLLFTSGNGVRAFAALSKRRDLPVFAVGDRTATLAREAGFERIESADGDVAALVALVRTHRTAEDGPLLHVSGHDVAGELAQSLEGAGYAVRRAVLYDAEPAADLAPATRTALGTGTLDGVLLFSPRTARHFSALMHLSGLSARAGRLTAWCLSPAVAQTLDGLKLGQIVIAPQPTQAALLALIPPAGTPATPQPAAGPKETILTTSPPPKPPANTKPPAIKKTRVEPTIAAAIPPEPAKTAPPKSEMPIEPKVETISPVPPIEPPIEPKITETTVTGEMLPPGLDFVAPFPFEMPEGEAPETTEPPPPTGPKQKSRQRRSPLVMVGIVALVVVGGAAVLGPTIKEKLEDAGLIGGPVIPPPGSGPAPGTQAEGTPTLHAGGSVTDTPPPEVSSGPHTMMPAHEPPVGSSPAPPAVSPSPTPTPAAASTPTPAPDKQTAAAPAAPSASAPDATASTPAAATPAPTADPVPGGVFTQRLEAAEARIDRLQATAAPIGSLNGLQQGVATLNQRLSNLETKPSADPASVQAVANDLQRVAASLNDAANRIARLELQVQQQATAQRNEKATVLALAELKDRLAGSGPFDGPVAALKAATGDDPAAGQALATLDHFAGQGVASRAKLGEELAGLPAAINQPLPTSADASLWERIQARATKLVSVQRIDDAGNVDTLPPGPDHSLAVATVALKAGDLAGAVQAVQDIDGHAGEVVKPWLAEARDRLAVEEAISQLNSLATRRLQGTGMPQPSAVQPPVQPKTLPAPAPQAPAPQAPAPQPPAPAADAPAPQAPAEAPIKLPAHEPSLTDPAPAPPADKAPDATPPSDQDAPK